MSDLLSRLSSMYDAPFDQNERDQKTGPAQPPMSDLLSMLSSVYGAPQPTGPAQPPRTAAPLPCDDEAPTTTTSASGISWLSDASTARKIITYRKYELQKKAAIHELHIALFTQLCLQCKYYETNGDVPAEAMTRLSADRTEITRLLTEFVTAPGSFFERALRDLVFLETQLRAHMSNEPDTDGVCTSVLSHRGQGAP